MAAECASAASDSAHHLRLISYPDLAKFDSHLKYRSKILNELTEINSSVSGEIEYNLAVVKGIFNIDQLHHKTVFINLFLTKLQCFFFLFDIFKVPLVIIIVGNPYDFFQRRYDFLFAHLRCLHRNRAELHASGRFDDYIITYLQFKIVRVKIVNFSGSFESDSYNSNHKFLQFLLSCLLSHNCNLRLR